MCIIIAKPQNIPMPPEKTLENCFSNNPDGAGYMYCHKGSVHIAKGFMTIRSLKESLSDLSKKVNLDKVAMVLHFRIGTQGRNDEGNTHPFPISDDITKLTKNSLKCNVAVAHNGIISLTSSYYSKDYSDTVIFVRDYLSCLIEKPNFYKNPNRIKVIDKLADSKLCFLSNDAHITTIGTFTEDKGVLYSNGTYTYSRYSYSSAYGSQTRYNAYGYGYNDEYDDDYTKVYPKTSERESSLPSNIFAKTWAYVEEVKIDSDVFLVDEETNSKILTLPNKYYVDDEGIVYGYRKAIDSWWTLRGVEAYIGGAKYRKIAGWSKDNVYLRLSNVGVISNKLFLTLEEENND